MLTLQTMFSKLWVLPLIPLPCQPGNKARGETAAVCSLGLLSSPRASLLAVAGASVPTEMEDKRQLRVCVLSWWHRGGWLNMGSWTSPPCFCGIGSRGLRAGFLCLPAPFPLPPTLAKPSQNYHLSQCFEYFAFLLLFFHLFLSWSLEFCLPLGPAVCGAPCPLWGILQAPTCSHSDP